MPKPDDPDAPCDHLLGAVFSDQDSGGLPLTAWSGSSLLGGLQLGNWASLTWKAEPWPARAELRVALPGPPRPRSPFGIPPRQLWHCG